MASRRTGANFAGSVGSVGSRWLDICQVLFSVYMDRYRVEVRKLLKKERGQYQAIFTLGQSKGFIRWFSIFLARYGG